MSSCKHKQGPKSFTVSGSIMTGSKDFYNGMKATVVLGTSEDLMKWENGAIWHLNRTK